MERWNYDEDVEDAKEMLAEAGQVGILYTTTVSPAQDAWAPDTESRTEKSCTFVELYYSSSSIDGTNIMSGDRKLLMSVEGLETTPPQEGDVVQIGQTEFRVMNVKPLSPGGVVIMWTVQVRG